jgi:hypothetical protein
MANEVRGRFSVPFTSSFSAITVSDPSDILRYYKTSYPFPPPSDEKRGSSGRNFLP